jgi:hypothetical protein
MLGLAGGTAAACGGGVGAAPLVGGSATVSMGSATDGAPS